MKLPLVSIVITTKNEESNIFNCLTSIKNQSYRNFEVIVVDNYSTDKTKEITLDFQVNFFEYGPERSAQRNLGMIGKSKGEYLIYIDADMVLTRGLIEECVKQVQDSKSSALYLPEIVLGKTFFARVRRFERQFYDGSSIDASRFFSKEIIEKVGGFDELLFKYGSGEDWDLDKRIKQEGEIAQLKPGDPYEVDEWLSEFSSRNGVSLDQNWQGILHNESTDKLFEYLKKKRYYANGFVGYINKWGKTDPDIKRQFGWKFRLFLVFFENGKWKTTLLNPFLYLMVLLLKILVGIATLSVWGNTFKKTRV
jgi:glycosyltransferase involved in cell wall biosynthesis